MLNMKRPKGVGPIQVERQSSRARLVGLRLRQEDAEELERLAQKAEAARKAEAAKQAQQAVDWERPTRRVWIGAVQGGSEPH